MFHNDLRSLSAPDCGIPPQGKGREGIGKEEEKNRFSSICLASPRREAQPRALGSQQATTRPGQMDGMQRTGVRGL